jgi:hypothetical protein
MGAMFGGAAPLAVLPAETVEIRDSVMRPFSGIEAVQCVAPLAAGGARLGDAELSLDGGGVFG